MLHPPASRVFPRSCGTCPLHRSFCNFPEELRATFDGLKTTVGFSRNQTIFEERERCHSVFAVCEGNVKLVTNDIIRESNVHTMLHCWVVATIVADGRVTGVIFESKQGRFALTAPVVIDCTGDGDVFAQAGASFDDDFDGESAHAA